MGHAKFADKELTETALTLVAMKLESMDQRIERRFATLEAKVDQHGAAIERLEGGQAEIRAEMDKRFSNVESLLTKILDGQAVLHQNDMELKRRLDTMGVK